MCVRFGESWFFTVLFSPCLYHMFGNCSLFNPKDCDLLTSPKAYSPPDHYAFLYCRDRLMVNSLEYFNNQ